MKPSEIHNKRILLSPLNWGMGHVARCIGIIRELLDNNNTIVIACNSKQEDAFRAYFTQLEYVPHDGYPFRFGEKGNFATDLLLRFRSLLRRSNRELKEVEELVKRFQIDIVLSDHRYGFRSSNVESVFITHQVNLPVRWFELPIQLIHKRLIGRFDQVWVLDYSDSRLAGKLSLNKNFTNLFYIGPYSRFQSKPNPSNKSGGTVLIASGPEVYAQELIDSIIDSKNELNLTVVCEAQMNVPNNVARSSEDWRNRDDHILNATNIISRSGYSTIMDLESLKIPAKLIPTPKQREQKYLAALHVENWKSIND